MMEHVIHGFGPVWDAASQVLVLGSMPSPKSRELGFYYMHPRNRFWPMMAAVFGGDPGRAPSERAAFALNHHVALWDVLASCDIAGASDGSIRNPVPNDISMIVRGAPIRLVITTGVKAGQLYAKLIEPGLRRLGIDVDMMTLASTSPANAAKSLDDLVVVYRDAFVRAGVLGQGTDGDGASDM
ncbi:DNA-deoxyinosine glycosylase [Bifidobacterium apri]|nr:DNA-deoxyinosine glycosylase [Bifidobacterium apri]